MVCIALCMVFYLLKKGYFYCFYTFRYVKIYYILYILLTILNIYYLNDDLIKKIEKKQLLLLIFESKDGSVVHVVYHTCLLSVASSEIFGFLFKKCSLFAVRPKTIRKSNRT